MTLQMRLHRQNTVCLLYSPNSKHREIEWFILVEAVKARRDEIINKI